MPVCSGSFTERRSTTPGAIASTGRVSLVTIGPFAVDGLSQRVHHAANQRFAHRDGHDVAGAADFVAFFDFLIFAQQHGSHLVFFQVERDAGDAVRKLHHLAGHHVFEAVNTGDAVAHRDHRSGFGNVDSLFVVLNFTAQQARDFISLDLSHKSIHPLFGRPIQPLIRGIRGQLSPQLPQLPADRPVVHRGPDARDHAAQQRRIDVESQSHALARQLRQAPIPDPRLKMRSAAPRRRPPRAQSPGARPVAARKPRESR